MKRVEQQLVCHELMKGSRLLLLKLSAPCGKDSTFVVITVCREHLHRVSVWSTCLKWEYGSRSSLLLSWGLLRESTGRAPVTVHFCPRQSDQPASAGDRLGVHPPDLRPDPAGGHAVSEQGLCSLVSKGAAALCPRVAGSLTLQGPMTLVESYLGCVLGFLSSGDSQDFSV